MEITCDAMLFDMDGTLVDSTAVVERAWGWWAARHHIALPEILAFSHGRPTRSTMEHFRPGIYVQDEVDEMEQFEERELDGIRPIPGAASAVQAAQGGPWAVVTSAPRRLAERRLEAAKLPIPQILVPADEIQRGKPDPEGFLKAAAQLGVPPARCVVFEDTRPGLAAANAAGMIAIGLLTTFPKDQLGCDLVIRDFEDIRIEHRHDEYLIALLRVDSNS